MIGAGAGGVGATILILLLLVLLGYFKVPHLMENITKWQFARVARQVQLQNQRVINTKVAIDSMNNAQDESFRGKVKSSGGNYRNRSPNLINTGQPRSPRIFAPAVR